MAFERVVEAIIQEALERGEFKDLAGNGKPIDLSAYFQAPEDSRVAQALLKDAGIVPREVELLQEIWGLRRRQAAARDHAAAQELRRRIADLQLELDLRTESQRRRHRAP